MGIKFQITGSAAHDFTFLRGYNRAPVETDADLGVKLDSKQWQAEGSTPGSATTLRQILTQRTSGIIGLFGLNQEEAEKWRASLTSGCDDTRFLVDLQIRVETSDTQDLNSQQVLRQIADGQILTRIARVCRLMPGLSNPETFVAEALKHMPPCRFIFDLTSTGGEPRITPAERLQACNEIVRFMHEHGNASGGAHHSALVFLSHRHHFNSESAETTSYLRLTEAWYRADVYPPDLVFDSSYAVKSRAHTRSASGNEPPQSFRDLVPVDRTWLYDELDRRMAAKDTGVIFLAGGPGTGKSYLLQRLTTYFDEKEQPKAPSDSDVDPPGPRTLVCSAGFSRQDAGKPRALLHFLCRQLLHCLGWDGTVPSAEADEEQWIDFTRKLLTAVDTWGNRPHWHHPGEDDSDGQRTGNGNTSSPRIATRRIILAVDALDEAKYPDENKGPGAAWRLLDQCFNSLPGNVRVLVSSRPGTTEQEKIPHDRILRLADRQWESQIRNDVEKLVRKNAGELPDEILKAILKAGDGNLLATALLLAFILQERRDKDDAAVREILQRLEAEPARSAEEVFSPIYDLFWERYRQSGLADEVLTAVSCVLATSPAAVPDALVEHVAAEMTGAGTLETQAVLETLERDSLVEVASPSESENASRLYTTWHKTFRDYLRHQLNPRVLKKQAWPLIAKWCADWESHKADPAARAYALRYAPHHLMEAGEWKDLYNLLVGPPDGKNFEYLEARMEHDEGTHGLVDDFRRVLGYLGEDQSIPLDEEKRALLEAFTKAFIQTQHTFDGEPQRCFQQIYALLNWHDAGARGPVSDWCEEARKNRDRAGRPWIRSLLPIIRDDVFTFARHAGQVRSASFSKNGKLVVSCDDKGICMVWNRSTGCVLRTFVADRDSVLSVAFSPDGEQIITGGMDRTGKVWNVRKRCKPQTLVGHADYVLSVAYSGDGRYIATGGKDRTLKLWTAKHTEASKPQTLRGHGGAVTSVAFSGNGLFLVSGSLDRTCRVWRIHNGRSKKEILILSGHTEAVTSVAVSQYGRYVVSGSKDRTCRIWDIGDRNGAKANRIQILRGHTHWVTSVAISSDNRYVVTGSRDRSCRIWDLETGKTIRMLREHTNGVIATDISAASGKQFIVSGSKDGSCKIWSFQPTESPVPLRSHLDDVRFLGFLRNGEQLLAGRDDGLCAIWDPEACKLMKTAERDYTRGALSVSFSAKGRLVVSGGRDGTCRVWDAESGELLQSLSGHTGWIRSVSFSEDSKQVLSASDDGTCRIWDVMRGCEQLTLIVEKRHVLAAAFSSRRDQHVASGDQGGICRVWNTKGTDRGSQILHGHSKPITSIAFSRNGRRIASSSEDGTCRIWDLAAPGNGPNSVVLSGHSQEVSSVIFAKDDRLVISTSRDGTCMFWDTQTGRRLTRFAVGAPIFRALLSPKEDRIALASASGLFLIEPISLGI